jgi:hypothetical protein
MKEKLKLILDYANANNDCWLRDKVQECLNELDNNSAVTNDKQGEYYLDAHESHYREQKALIEKGLLTETKLG